jgi:hypothetical protein
MRTTICLTLLASASVCFAAASEPGLLFYLSGDNGFTADYAAGKGEPNFLANVKIIPDGARGKGFECANTQLMAYWAPGNIYAQRGTLAFSWRSRYPVGPTPFPIFRVGYADHSSWDMVWLRIDYNGEGGFDAFVTDINLSRIRVRYQMPAFPKPNEWVHLALAWDETVGIRFYVNGVLAVKKDQKAVLYTGLDQFGPHSRAISPWQVQSAYNFLRGGDIDEIRIYDRMLSDDNVASVAKGVAPQQIPALARELAKLQWQEEWWLRYGWNRKGDVPPYLASAKTAIRKVEIHDVYDLKRWWWKATDGIRETTWPGVYNRSRLPGRNDYFQLPDWDCYMLSGKAVTFTMPNEPWNHLEISGSAWGKMYLEGDAKKVLFERPKGQEKTFHHLKTPLTGQKIRFENVEQEEPIGELSAYYVAPSAEPQGTARLVYTVSSTAPADDASLKPLAAYVNGRFAGDERQLMVGVAGTAPQGASKPSQAGSLPLVHIVIPAAAWQDIKDGLDGIAIDLPALKVKPTHGAYFPMNVRVKDPLWTDRDMLDFSFSVKPGEARTLWLDTRDRILPPGKGLYLTIAGAGADFGSAALEGAQVRLIFKARADAVKEHELDRFTQVRDVYAMMVEEHSNSTRLNMYNRFVADTTDLLRVNPNHWLGQVYWYDENKSRPKPAFTQPTAPPGVPLWAFRQVTQLDYLKKFILWYIDDRQIEDGELGGGLSDDGDLTNDWPGLAYMGVEPEKVKQSDLRELDAFYAGHQFTKGLSTIMADELHSYEEGISVLGQALLLDYGSPKQLERAMETARGAIGLTGVNKAGHCHIRTCYFNGEKMSTEEPWGWSKPSSYLILHPGLMLVDFNGNPKMKQTLLQLADGLLAHRKLGADGKYHLNSTIRFEDDQDEAGGVDRLWPILWGAWRWTGDTKYLAPLQDEGPRRFLELVNSDALDLLNLRNTYGHEVAGSVKPGSGTDADQYVAWQVTGDKKYLESLFAHQIETSALREYINTEGSLWIDRVMVPEFELQRTRLGGVPLVRNYYYPGHAVSWKFQAPATAESVAILIPSATPEQMKIIAYNLDQAPVQATLTAWGVDPGKWEVVQGVDTKGDDAADSSLSTRTVDLERSTDLQLTLPPRATTVLTLKLVSKGTPYWERPDLGIGKEDVKVQGKQVRVTVHSLGSVDTPATTVALIDRSGKVLASVPVPALKAPLDMFPKTTTVTLTVPNGASLAGGSVVIDPGATLKEITRMNNRVAL